MFLQNTIIIDSLLVSFPYEAAERTAKNFSGYLDMLGI